MVRRKLIKRIEQLMFDFDNAESYILTEELKPYKKSICTYIHLMYGGDVLFVPTDSYGMAGFIVTTCEFDEQIGNYINSLEPSNKDEYNDWFENTIASVIDLMDI